MLQGIISAYRPTVWTKMKHIQEEQSDLGPYFLLRFYEISTAHKNYNTDK